MIEIKKRWWYFTSSPELRGKSTMRCDSCNGFLPKWYAIVVESIKRFLPKNYKYYCCGCTLLKTVKNNFGYKQHTKCKKCGDVVTIGCNFGTGEIVVKCFGCQEIYKEIEPAQVSFLMKEELMSKWHES